MRALLKKSGDGAALRIPAPLLAAAGLAEGPVELREEGGRIIIEAPSEPLLERLIGGITPENRHDEADFGLPVGRETL